MVARENESKLPPFYEPINSGEERMPEVIKKKRKQGCHAAPPAGSLSGSASIVATI